MQAPRAHACSTLDTANLVSSPETNSMAGRVCVQNERHFLRDYHRSPMNFHALKHAIGEKGEHQHERA